MKLISTLLFSLLIGICTAQTSQVPPISMRFQNGPYGLIAELPLAPPRVLGNHYLYTEWNSATIYLNDDMEIEQIPIRIDLENQHIEIMHSEVIKVLSFSKIKAIDIMKTHGTKEHFMNGESFIFAGDKVKGLFKVIVSGKFSLILNTHTEVISSTYNKALDVGTRDAQVQQSHQYYILKDRTVVKVGNNKSKLADIIHEVYKQDASDIIRKAKLKDEQSLVSMINALNEISELD